MFDLDRDYLIELDRLGDSILDYSEIGSDVSEIINSSKKSVEQLYEIGWKGDAKEKFSEDFNSWIEEANEFVNNIFQLENSLKVMYIKSQQLKDEGGNLATYL